MEITYCGPADEVEITSLGLTCKRGESVTVPAAAGDNLLRQSDWAATVHPKVVK